MSAGNRASAGIIHLTAVLCVVLLDIVAIAAYMQAMLHLQDSRFLQRAGGQINHIITRCIEVSNNRVVFSD